MNRKQYDTLFCSLSPDIPTTATSLAVVKTLLIQLLGLRVGNMSLYYAVFKAYHQCRSTGDLKVYEDYLWTALGEALSHPVDGGNELVIVVDGLDEIADSRSASIQASGAISPAALLEKLVSATNQGRGVKLITLGSSSIKLRAMTCVTISTLLHCALWSTTITSMTNARTIKSSFLTVSFKYLTDLSSTRSSCARS
jgi:hypothetical protein